jgi:hypothetical protein
VQQQEHELLPHKEQGGQKLKDEKVLAQKQGTEREGSVLPEGKSSQI